MPRKTGWMLLVTANVLVYCVLSFCQTTGAQTGKAPSLANSVEQRHEMVSNLEEIKNLLKEQNELLQSGKVKVIVTEMPKS